MPHGHESILDPVVTDIYRVQFELQLKSELPEDRIVSVWHFRNVNIGGSQSAAGNDAINAVRQFYFETIEGGLGCVCNFMSGAAVSTGVFRAYDLGQPKPRAPVASSMMTPTEKQTFLASGGPPFEVACAVSWKTAVIAPKTGTVGKTGRGRTYLGPLGSNALTATPLGYPKIADVLRTVIAAAGNRLITRNGARVGVLSRKYAQFDPIIGGYIDDAPDTQRRRGQTRQNRVMFQPGTGTVTV